MPKPPRALGFTTAKARLLDALTRGDVQHEPREALAEKNLLAVGAVTLDDVKRMVASCTGQQYDRSAHHQVANTEVHEFFPGRGYPGRPQWYVKAYFAPAVRGQYPAVFISVHKSVYR